VHIAWYMDWRRWVEGGQRGDVVYGHSRVSDGAWSALAVAVAIGYPYKTEYNRESDRSYERREHNCSGF
jgi:hypothetical protein